MCRALLVFWWWSDLLPEVSESQYDKTGVGDSRGHCVAISVYVQAYTPHDEDEKNGESSQLHSCVVAKAKPEGL